MAIPSDHSVPDLLSVGTHCALSECQQLDFLPFECKNCGLTFCKDHRTAQAHLCKAVPREADTLVCPVCALVIRPRAGESPDAAFERHTAAGECDPTNYARVHNKKRCPVPRCKQKLTSVSSYNCKACGATVCLAHRLPADHACAGTRVSSKSQRAGDAAQARLAAVFGRRPRPTSADGSSASSDGKSGSSSERPDEAGPQNTGFAAMLQSFWGWASATDTPSNGRPSQPPSPAAALVEQCSSCSARFATVAELIEHAEGHHALGWASGRIGGKRGAGLAGATPDPCPLCGARFETTEALTAHASRHFDR